MDRPVTPVGLSGKWTYLMRRLMFLGPVTGLTVFATCYMIDIAMVDGLSGLDIVVTGLFSIAFFMIVLSFCAAAVGFCIKLVSKDPARFVCPPMAAENHKKDGSLEGRAAIVMPIRNEDAAACWARLETLRENLLKTPNWDRFSFFILSDTDDEAIAAEEDRLWRASRSGPSGIIYRRRNNNTGRKAGNIADFCHRWGSDFDYMTVLDADSQMDAGLVCDMVRAMDACPQVGLIQTLPMITGQTTLFGRIVQFGHRLTAEFYALGHAFWQGGEANYYGHNAIIRIAPFVEHCDLPVLPGRGPLSGEILSHDFVEAAFMRRAGYRIWSYPAGHGSEEEVPTNLIEFAKRDNRWCQGNLQHSRLLFGKGLHWVSRLHLGFGILSYLTSPIWLVLLLVSIVQACGMSGYMGLPIASSICLVPLWPEVKVSEMAWLFASVFAMLAAPRGFALAATLANRERRKISGGAFRLVASTLFEFMFSMLIAPVMMVFQSKFILALLAGKRVAWDSQDRGNSGIGWAFSTRVLYWQSGLGILALGLIGNLAPELILWFVPSSIGLMLCIPLTVISSRVAIGRFGFAPSLFRTELSSAAAPPTPQYEAAVSVVDAHIKAR